MENIEYVPKNLLQLEVNGGKNQIESNKTQSQNLIVQKN